MDIIKILIGLIVIVLILYVGFQMFISMVKTLWELSPITSIGFVISIIIAILKGHIRLDKFEENLRIMFFIFGGTVISYMATNLIPDLIGFITAGELIGSLIIGVVILMIWFKGQEIKGWE